MQGPSMPRPSNPSLRPVPDPDSAQQPLSAAEVDEILVGRAQRGDGNAWARLYQRHFDAVYKDVLYMVEQSATAEELVQEAFAAALVSLQRFDGRASIRTWLRGIAQNLVRKHWRSHSRRGRAYDRAEREAPLLGPRTGDDPESSHLRERRARVLSEVLATLPDPLREVFVMRDVQGLPVEEVADLLKISAGNVRVRANRARGRIRDELTRLGWLEEGAS